MYILNILGSVIFDFDLIIIAPAMSPLNEMITPMKTLVKILKAAVRILGLVSVFQNINVHVFVC